MQTSTRCPFVRRPLPGALLLLLLLLSSAAAWAQPTVTGFSPASGASGSTISVTGTGFTNVTSVRFGELSATFTVNSSTQITATVPRAASTQVINVTTTAGSEISPTAFAVTRNSSLTYTLAANNFAGVSVGSNAAPAVGDLDGDGRLDLLVGRADGTVGRYEQTTANGTTFTYLGLLATSGGTINRGANATVAIVDTDSNGKFSVLLGGADGYVYDYEQTTAGSTTFGLVNSFVGQISTTSNSAPSVTNLDGDGRLELVTGKGDGIVSYAEQFARNSEDFTIYDTNYQTLTSNSAPFCVDLDGNGLVDVLIGVAGGNIYRFEQSAAGNTTLNQITSNFNSISAGTNAKPCVTDIDGNGLLDLLVGRANGTIDRYEQAPPNTAPTALVLSPSSVAENVAAGTTVGTFSTTDAQGGPFTYALVSGTGSSSNASFGISGSSLTINASPDYEANNSYAIRVRTTDPGGLSFEQVFTIAVTDVAEVPTVTGFTPTSGLVGANNIVITGTHFNDAGAPTVRFNGTTATATVNSNTQLTATVPSGATTGRITVQNADGTGTSTTDFTVTPANTAPTDISLTPSSVAENQPVSTPVGTLSTTDAQGGSFTYIFVSGGANNGLFNIQGGNTLTTNGVFDFETKNSYTIRLRSTDQGGLSFEKDLTITVTNVAEVPTVSSFTPTSGLTGISVTITGTHFNDAGAPTVRFNGTTATAFTVNSNTQLTATVPAGTTTGRITVQNADGTGISTTDFTVPAPNTTIVSGPPTLGNNSTVSFVFSSDQSPVDYTTSGAPNATYTGNSANSNFGPIPDGTYTLRVAARNTSTGVSDQSPATYTFTVDTQRPAPVVTSTAGSSGSSTSTSPIPFTVTFSENVLGFVNDDVTVTGGTLTSASAASASVYNLVVTPTAPGSVVTVSIAANVATDAAGNGNTASNAYSLTYAPAPTITSFTPTSGLAGTSVTITGTGFIGLITVAFNGTQVMGLTGSSTQLNVSVPAGATTGFITVTTPSGTATSSSVFTVPVNQAPVVTVPATQNTAFNTANVFSTANGNALSVADADAGSGQLAIYIQAVQGAVTLASTTGLTITSGSNGGGSFGFTGTLTAINAALNGLTFSPNSGFSGPASVQLQVNDQGNTGSGGAKSDSKTVTINVGTAAPVVSYPTTGSTIASTTPPYNGTAPASSLVTVYVDNASIGTTTATAGGSWSFAQPSALSQATHTVKATAQRSGAIVSGFGNVVSFTVDVTAPSVPVVSSPANGSFVSTPRPPYNGTGASGSIITVYVDNVSVGTTTIAAGGSTWGFTQPTALSDAAHTVKVTATDGVGNVSAASATNTFTVDTQVPTVAVSSPVGASGSTTATAPVPFTITFSEPVTGFSLSDITVSSGTPGSFTTVSASQYTFSVTPAGAGTITVSVPVGVANDRAGNTNVPSFGPAFNLNYTPAPAITSLTPNSGPVGTSVVIVGSSLSGATGVRFNGTAAGSFVVNSATQITAVVTAGTNTGLVTVTTPNGTSNGLTFTVTAAGTSTALASSLNPSTFGQSVTFTATVTVPAPGSGLPTGTITFLDGSTMLGTGPVAANGQATFTTASLAQGSHSITAEFASSASYAPSTSAVLTQVVNAAPVAGPTVTSLSASAELPGMPVVITGTGFTSGSTVRFGGTPATSVTFTSATSLTAVVPAGATVGSTALTVTTASGSATAPAFTVLEVYSGGSLNDCAAALLATTTTGDGVWHYLLSSAGQVVLAYNYTGASLGTFSADVLRASPTGPVRQDARGSYYLDRNFHLTASGGAFAGRSVQVRFYSLTSELAHLTVADPAATLATLKANQYSGPNEDCDLANNGAGESRVLPLAASTPGGVAWFVAQATVADHFSEFYLTGSAAPLPVKLTTFTAERRGSAVALAWRTASELNSARFEVERSLDGVAFARIGQVAAQGSKATATDYAFADAQPLAARSYYRLRQVDRDGTAAFSPVRTVTFAAPMVVLAAYPVPAHAGQLLTVTGAAAGAAVEVFDAVGRRVAAATATPGGTATLGLPRELASGVYVLRSANGTRRLVVE